MQVPYSTSEAPGAGVDGSESAKRASRRAVLTPNACARCRQRKSKCDGGRPSCDGCIKHGAACVYEIAEAGVTRMQHLKQQLLDKTIECDQKSEILQSLQRGTEKDAAYWLVRLREGESHEVIWSSMKASNVLGSANQKLPAADQSWLSIAADPVGWVPPVNTVVQNVDPALFHTPTWPTTSATDSNIAGPSTSQLTWYTTTQEEDNEE